MYFWNSLAFSMIQWMLAIWSLFPLPFLKPSLNIWKFTVHILLKPGLENSEHYFPSVWDECNCAVFLAFFGVSVELLGIDYFQRAIIGVVLVCVFIWIDVCLELSWFFNDPADVGNLTSGSSAFSKTSLNSGSSRFTYCWSLAWRILSISLLACEMSGIVW